jgi:hypothetical protein
VSTLRRDQCPKHRWLHSHETSRVYIQCSRLEFDAGWCSQCNPANSHQEEDEWVPANKSMSIKQPRYASQKPDRSSIPSRISYNDNGFRGLLTPCLVRARTHSWESSTHRSNVCESMENSLPLFRSKNYPFLYRRTRECEEVPSCTTVAINYPSI